MNEALISKRSVFMLFNYSNIFAKLKAFNMVISDNNGKSGVVSLEMQTAKLSHGVWREGQQVSNFSGG